MKRIITILITVSMMLLTGCINTQNESETIDNIPKLDIVHTTKQGGATQVYGCSFGAYYLSTQNSAIKFWDKNSNISTILCNRPECRHIDDTCTAFAPSSNYQLFMNPEENKLFLTYTKDELSDRGWPIFYIEAMDINGDNRQVIYKITDGDFYRDFAFCEDSMYFITRKFDNENKAYYFNLIELNYLTGEIKILDKFDNSRNIIAAFDNYLILEYDNGSLSHADNTIFKYDIISKEETSLYSYTANGNISSNVAYAKNNYLYIFEPISENKAKLYEVDITSNNERLINDNVSFFGLHTGVSNPAIILEDYLIISSMIPPTNGAIFPYTETYLIDLKSGEEIFINLKNTEEFIPLYEISDSLVLYIGSERTTISISNLDGTETYLNALMPQHAIINKSDYIASNKNLTILQ